MRTRSLFPYAGGKFYLMNEIREVFEKSGKHVAVDVFGGSGKFLLNVEARNKVYNDIDSRLVNLFSVIKERPLEFRQKFESFVYSRELFEKCVDGPETGEPVEDAFRTLYVFCCSFAGKGGTFGYQVRDRKSLGRKVADVSTRLQDFHNEVQGWTIEHLDFRDLMKRYDSEDAFFYLDPPYFGKKFYRHNFTEKDFEDLAALLHALKGKYLLNINKNEFILSKFGEPSKESKFKTFCDNARASGKRGNRTELFYWN